MGSSYSTNVDEAQLAKSKNTLRGRAVRALKPKGKLILTGTLMGVISNALWKLRYAATCPVAVDYLDRGTLQAESWNKLEKVYQLVRHAARRRSSSRAYAPWSLYKLSCWGGEADIFRHRW